MKLKADRVCFANSARARVLPDRSREEITEMPAPAKTGNMIGATRCDESMIKFIHEVTAKNELIRVESAGHNRLRWFGPGGKSATTHATLSGDRQIDEVTEALGRAGILLPDDQVPATDTLMEFLESKLNIRVSTGSGYLLHQFIEALGVDVSNALENGSKTRIDETRELLELAQQELDEHKRQTAAETRDLIRQRDEARTRAERAERALSALNAALRGAADIVSGTE